ncbi:MAG: hypothetical protein IPM26_02725 [Saprospiraceae bacterium]|nr:hypothetical protein [Saprospiraceae bacterium]
MANVSETTLLNMPWVNTETVFTGSVTTVQGVWNEITFEKPFFWDGTSSLYFEFCFNNSSYTLNDLLRFTNPVGGGTGRYVEALIQDGSNGCILTSADANFVNYSNFSIQPHFQFRQLNAAKIETAVTATSNKSSLKSGETANFYSSNGRVYASVRNIGATDINCIEAAIETAGSSTPALPFGGGNYSAKTIKIDASYNAVYEVTLYYTQAELSAFGTNANRLNIIKTQSTLATATLANSVIYRPDSIISGFGPDNAYGYRGTFSGFSRFAVTNRNVEVGSSISGGDLVINESGRGFILKNKSGQNFLTTVTNAGTLSTQSATALNGTSLNKSDLNINTTARNLILRSPNGTYRRLNVSDTGVLSIADTTLPAVSARLNSGNLVLQENGGAILMKSPNGNCWRIFVNETGQLSSVLTLCP